MPKKGNDTTQMIIDGILQFVAAGGFVSVAVLAPNAVQIFDKPLEKFMKTMDKRSREREIRRVAYYMKQQGLIRYDTRDYEHGIKLTKAGKKRLVQAEQSSISIPRPEKWDKKWRLVFFDVPEAERRKRNRLTRALRALGYQQLQRSIWIHPFPSRPEIEALAEDLAVRKYLTYVEINDIDAAEELRTRFTKVFKR